MATPPEKEACPECGALVKVGGMGLMMHNRFKHPDKIKSKSTSPPRKPAEPIPIPKPSEDEEEEHDEACECDDCTLEMLGQE